MVAILSILIVPVATAASMNPLTGKDVSAFAKTYEKTQVITQAEACGNGELPLNILCQNIGSEIQGDKNAANIVGLQTGGDIPRPDGDLDLGFLTVTKQVICPEGFTCPEPGAFTINVAGNSPDPSSFQGSTMATVVSLEPGVYLVSEISPDAPEGLVAEPPLFSEDCSGNMQAGQELNCTITNEFVPGTVIPLKEAKLNVEHNARDEDTGFQGFLDSEGWNKMTVTGPDGRVLNLNGEGKLGQLGLTELFFETVEPPNADVPIAEVLETLPEGEYLFEGSAIEAGEKQGRTIGTALLTHEIPEGPELLSPAENATVPEDSDLLVSWSPVDKSIDGSPINIIAYQLIIEKDEDPHPHMIGKMGLSMYLPPDVTEMTISSEFLEPETDYLWEVLAIEESGNQSLNSSRFSTSA